MFSWKLFLGQFKAIPMILGLFIFILSSIGDWIKPFINKEKLSYFLRKYTSNRFICCLIGFICTAILKSAHSVTIF